MNRKLTRFIPGLGSILIVAGLSGAALDVCADVDFKMQIHPQETQGTWALANDKYKEAVVRLEIERARSGPRARTWPAILSNLCVAYAKVGDYEHATGYCDQAVEDAPKSGIALNNRGVLAALQGDFIAAAADFEAARQREGSAEFAAHNIQRLGEQVSEYRGDTPTDAVADAIS